MELNGRLAQCQGCAEIIVESHFFDSRRSPRSDKQSLSGVKFKPPNCEIKETGNSCQGSSFTPEVWT